MTPPSLPRRADLDELLSRHLGGLFAQDVPPERLARAVADLYDALLARLRPAWERLEAKQTRTQEWLEKFQGAASEEALKVAKITRERDALREQVAACVEAIEYLDRVLVAEGLMPGIGFSPLWMGASAAMKAARAALARVDP